MSRLKNHFYSVKEKHLREIAKLLYVKFKKQRGKEKYASVKEILSFLAKGGFLLSCFIAPGMGRLSPDVLKERQPDWQEWQKFNKSYLRRSLRRLRRQKLIEIKKDKQKEIIKITPAGQKRILKYSLNELEIEKPKTWDGKWRLIIYDVPAKQRYFQGLFRQAISKLGLYQLQKSVFLTPFPCQKQIDFLREYFKVSKGVLYMVVDKFENDDIYKKYFGL